MANKENLKMLREDSVETWNKYRQGIPGFAVDLSGAVLSGAVLGGANLRGVNLKRADLPDADLSDADLRGANLSDANLRGADLNDANLRDADLHGADLQEANLNNTNLTDADLSGADLRAAHMDFAILIGADLNGASLFRAFLTGADMHGVNLRDAILTEAILKDANLNGADLRGADLQRADLTEVDLCGVDLHGANLRDAALVKTRYDQTTKGLSVLTQRQRDCMINLNDGFENNDHDAEDVVAPEIGERPPIFPKPADRSIVSGQLNTTKARLKLKVSLHALTELRDEMNKSNSIHDTNDLILLRIVVSAAVEILEVPDYPDWIVDLLKGLGKQLRLAKRATEPEILPIPFAGKVAKASSEFDDFLSEIGLI